MPADDKRLEFECSRTWDSLARTTDYWRAATGALILLIVLVFPLGIGGALSQLVAWYTARRQR